jgi:UDP-N-acetylglucosamine:LPS N-acetylglucosamine transferase
MQKESQPIKYDYTAVLSGPEPQRTKLEALLIKAFSNSSSHRFCIVRGTTKEQHVDTKIENIEIFDFLTSQKLNDVMNESTHIICRSGYTSIMDLIQLELPATLIPTPGQYEQEYLAKRLNGKYKFSVCLQENCISHLERKFLS